LGPIILFVRDKVPEKGFDCLVGSLGLSVCPRIPSHGWHWMNAEQALDLDPKFENKKRPSIGNIIVRESMKTDKTVKKSKRKMFGVPILVCRHQVHTLCQMIHNDQDRVKST
jgi:hypothetical protein